uniref:uncharacterized protein LOC105351492 n=1 Tax=Fragaria vesca subsp. vesca TaxID=101020 RepID=UPI0005C8865E|nr:PREDICTED: uncharacterized protein LOC105351492 [Fragaria vesca subsp. vesca]
MRPTNLKQNSDTVWWSFGGAASVGFQSGGLGVRLRLSFGKEVFLNSFYEREEVLGFGVWQTEDWKIHGDYDEIPASDRNPAEYSGKYSGEGQIWQKRLRRGIDSGL